MALCKFGHVSLVNKISQKLLKLEPWNLMNRLVAMSRWPDYAPSFEWNWWGILFCLHLSIRLFVRSSSVFCACHIIRTLHARVLKFYIWVPNEKIVDTYFVSCLACLFKVMPLWKKSELNLVSKISWKVFKLGSWNSIQWVGMMCTLPDYILREFHENIDKVTALCSSAHFDLVSKISRKALKLEPASVAQLDAPSDWRPGGRGFSKISQKVFKLEPWYLVYWLGLRRRSPE